jgi:hypothetical protein
MHLLLVTGKGLDDNLLALAVIHRQFGKKYEFSREILRNGDGSGDVIFSAKSVHGNA